MTSVGYVYLAQEMKDHSWQTFTRMLHQRGPLVRACAVAMVFCTNFRQVLL